MNQSTTQQAQVTLERKGNFISMNGTLFASNFNQLDYICANVARLLLRPVQESEAVHIQSMLGTPGEHSVRKLWIGPGAMLKAEVWGAEGR